MDNTAKKICNLLPNGKCSNCKTKVKQDRAGYTAITKATILEISKTERYIVCHNCGYLIVYY